MKTKHDKQYRVPITEFGSGMERIGRAARWLRKVYCVPNLQTIDPLFEKTFKCRVKRDRYGIAQEVVFRSEQDYLLFTLQWS